MTRGMPNILARTLRRSAFRRALALADRAVGGGRLTALAGAAAARLRQPAAAAPEAAASLLFSFPPKAARPVGIASARYQNRREFLPGVHLETRAGDRVTSFAVASSGSPLNNSYVLACEARHVDPYLRWSFHFPLERVGNAQFLHLSWTARLKEGGPPIPVSVMLSDNAGNGKTTAQALSAQVSAAQVSAAHVSAANGGWQQRHVVLGTSGLPASGHLNLVFSMQSGTSLEIGDVAVVAVALGEGADAPFAPSGIAWEGQPLPGRSRSAPGVPLSPGPYVFVAGLGALRVAGVGWGAAGLADPALELIADGETVAETSLHRTPASAGRPASVGTFAFNLPARFADGRERSFTVRLKGGAALLNSPVSARFEAAAPDRHEGLFWLEPNGDLAGWAVDRSWPESPVRLDVRIDGTVVETIAADRKHPVLTGPEYRDGWCAFRVPLEGRTGGAGVHAVSVGVAGGSDLPGGPVMVSEAMPRRALHLAEAAGGRISGWAVDLDRPNTPLRLDVWVDKRPFGRITADKPGAAQGAARRHGFSAGYPPGARLIEFKGEDKESLAVFDILHEPFPVRGQAAVPADRDRLAGANAALLREIEAKPERFVDAPWYGAAHPAAELDAASSPEAAAAHHWLAQGAARGWSPVPWFSERWYVGEYEDVRALVGEGVVHSGYLHWLAQGAAEWRKPHPGFSFESVAPDAGGLDPAALIRTWLASAREAAAPAAAGAAMPGLIPGPAEGKADGQARRQLSSRIRRDSLFDTFVDRITADLRRSEPEMAEALRTGMDDADVRSLELCAAGPVPDVPLVSVVMPTFNRGHLISEAIQSVLDQSWANWELIVCDDGSTDRTAGVVAAFGDPRIRFIALQKANGAAARNVGLRFAAGEFIAFLDSDNIWHPLFLQTAMSGLARTGAAMVYLDYVDSRTEGARFTLAQIKTTGFSFLSLLTRNFIDLNTLVLKAGIPALLGGFDETLPRVQDWDLVLRYAHVVEPVHIPLPLILYRRNAAWGQVTDLFAHTDFNAVVHERALARVENGAPSQWAVPAGRPVVCVVGGNSAADGLYAMAMGRLLEGMAETRLILPDIAELRQAAAVLDLERRLRLVWLGAGADFRQDLTGEVVIATRDAVGDRFAAKPGAAPDFVLERHGSSAVLLDPRMPADPGVALGALRFFEDEEEWESGEPAPPAERPIHAVAVVSQPQAWADALRAVCPPGRTSIVAVLEGHGVRQMRIGAALGGEGWEAAEPASLAALGRAVADAAALILAPGDDASVPAAAGLAVLALKGGTLLFAAPGTAASSWTAANCALDLPPDPAAAARLLAAAFRDAAAPRLQTNARREYGYLHRPSVMRQRLRIYLDLKRARRPA